MRRLTAHLPSHATVVAYLSLFVALGGVGAYAADRIGSSDIKRNAVRAKHIKNGHVRGPEVLNGSLSVADVADQVVDVSFDPEPLAQGTCGSNFDVPVPGKQAGDRVLVLTGGPTWDGRIALDGYSPSGNVNGTGAIRVSLCNLSVDNINPNNISMRVLLFR